jgi:hypothetical protein
MVHNSRRHNTE